MRKHDASNVRPVASGRRFRIPFAIVLSIVWGGLSEHGAAETLSYNREVLPILAEHCLACHGVDRAQRKANLRLDSMTSAYAERDGVRAIVPSKPEQSELISRIFSDDPDYAMPPPEHGTQLDDRERRTLRQWVAEGGAYERHWAFVKPVKAE